MLEPHRERAPRALRELWLPALRLGLGERVEHVPLPRLDPSSGVEDRHVAPRVAERLGRGDPGGAGADDHGGHAATPAATPAGPGPLAALTRPDPL